MTRDRFAEILREHGYSSFQIALLWESRPTDDLDEDKLRETAKRMAPTKDALVQA